MKKFIYVHGYISSLKFFLKSISCIFTTDLYNKSQKQQSRNDSILQHFRFSEVFLQGLKNIIETLLSIVCRIHLKFSFFIICKGNSYVSRIFILKIICRKPIKQCLSFFSLSQGRFLLVILRLLKQHSISQQLSLTVKSLTSSILED